MDFTPNIQLPGPREGVSADLPRISIKVEEALIGIDSRGRFFTNYVVDATIYTTTASEGSNVSILRRYSDFRLLHRLILSLKVPQRPETAAIPRLTSRKVGFVSSAVQEELVAKRKRKLGIYIQVLCVLSQQYPAVHALVSDFICPSPASNRDGAFEGEGDAQTDSGGEGEGTVPTPGPRPSEGERKAATQGPRLSNLLASFAGSKKDKGKGPGGEGLAKPDHAAAPDTPTCLVCGRPMPLPAHASAPLSFDSSRFCTPQCERFNTALKANNYAMAGGVIATAASVRPPIVPSSSPLTLPIGTPRTDGASSGSGGKSSSGKGATSRLSGWFAFMRKGEGEGADVRASTGAGVGVGGSPTPTHQGTHTHDGGLGGDVTQASPHVGSGVAIGAGAGLEGYGGGGRRRSGSIIDLGTERSRAGTDGSVSALDDAPAPPGFLSKKEEEEDGMRRVSSMRFKVVGAGAGGGGLLSKLGFATAPAASSDREASVPSPYPPNDIEVSQVIIRTGLVWKQGAVRRSWKVRRLILSLRGLSYFQRDSSSRATESKLLGSLGLLSARSPPASVLIDIAARLLAGTVLSPLPTSSSSVETEMRTASFQQALFARCRQRGYIFAEVFLVCGEKRGAGVGADGYEADLAASMDGIVLLQDDLRRSLPRELLKHTQQQGGPFLASVRTSERELVLGWETSADRRQWLEAMRSLVLNEQNRLLAVLLTHSRDVRAGAEEALTLVHGSGRERWGGWAVREEGGLHSAAGSVHRRSTPIVSQGRDLQVDVSRQSDEWGEEGDGVEGGPLPSAQSAAVPTTAAQAALPPTFPHQRLRFLSGPSLAAGLSSSSFTGTDTGAGVGAHPAGAWDGNDMGKGQSGALTFASPGFGLALELPGVISNPSPDDFSEMNPTDENAAPVANAHGATAASPSTGVSSALSKPASGDHFAGGWELSEDEVTIIERIGSGSYGEVFRGKLWGTDVAVKLLLAGTKSVGGDGLGSDGSLLASLQAEVSVLATLRHPNVVLYMGASLSSSPFIVTEWCERGALDDILYDKSIPLSASARVSFALQTARGMAYLHSARRGIIHRDLKARNLLVTRDWAIKVADFGLTVTLKNHAKGDKKLAGIGPATGDAADADSTGFYGVEGTPQFMAPEVMEGQAYNSSVDVYAFGIVLAELTGRILPYSDAYRRFDFVDAVLEEGALPTLPRWCGSFPANGPIVPAPSVAGDGEGEGAPQTAVTADGAVWGWEEEATAIRAYACRLGVTSMRPCPANTSQGVGVGVSPPPPPPPQRGIERERSDASISSVASAAGLAGGEGGEEEASPNLTRLPLGGTHEWAIAPGGCTGALRLLTEACVSRDSETRPTFEALAEVLGVLAGQPSRDVFLQLELPRLREALAYGDDIDAAVAANEIIHCAASALFAAFPRLPQHGQPVHGMGTGTGTALHSLLGTTSASGPTAGAIGRRARGAGSMGSPVAGAGAGGAATGEVGAKNVQGQLLGRMLGTLATATAESTGRAGLTVRFPAGSTAFLPLLAFAPPPSSSLSSGGVSSTTPVADLRAVMEAGAQLLGGLAARLRVNDLTHRARQGIPLRCADITLAVKGSGLPGTAGVLVIVKKEVGSRGATPPVPSSQPSKSVGLGSAAGRGRTLPLPSGVADTCRFGEVCMPVPQPACCVVVLLSAYTGGADAEEEGGGGLLAAPPLPILPGSSTAARVAAKNAAKAAAARTEEERARRKAQVASTAQLVHALALLTAVLDAGASATCGGSGFGRWPGAQDEHGEMAWSRLSNVALPTPGTLDALLLSVSARLIYPLCTVAVTSSLEAWERAFISRPTGGSWGAWGKGWGGAHTPAAGLSSPASFPTLHDFGPDALECACGYLVGLWDRLPLLRASIAHVLAVTTAAAAVQLGEVQVQVQRPDAHGSPQGPVGGQGLGVSGFISVPISEEVVAARFAGIVLERLQIAAVADSASLQSVASNVRLPSRHPLVAAVEARLRGALLRRQDGIITGTLDVEPFDPELC